MVTHLEGILRRISELPRRDLTESEVLEDLVLDAHTEAEMQEAEGDRLRACLSDALAIVDTVAAEAGLPQDPCFALALLNEDEQRRLYALLKGRDGL